MTTILEKLSTLVLFLVAYFDSFSIFFSYSAATSLKAFNVGRCPKPPQKKCDVLYERPLTKRGIKDLLKTSKIQLLSREKTLKKPLKMDMKTS